MKVFFICIMAFLLGIPFFLVVGNYSGGCLFLYLKSIPVSEVTWWTLYDAAQLPYKHPDFSKAIWGCVLAVWIVFLAVFSAVMTIWLYLLPRNKALYGDARFANDKELASFHYKGDYY